MLKQGGVYRENQEVVDRVMDSNDLERERGITILAKNTSVHYNGVKINIVDTPGHADFSGEVERILKMVNGVLLLVDSFEGTMPQTRFVLQKALELGHKIIVVVNKTDRPDARNKEVVNEVLELLLDLDATEEQIDSPVVFCSGRLGCSSYNPDEMGDNFVPLFNKIIEHIPAPEGNENGELQLLVSSIDYNDYVGRIAVGRVERGKIRVNQEVIVCDHHNRVTPYKAKIVSLYQFDGLGRTSVEEATGGRIVPFSGIENITIGETVCSVNAPEPLPFVKITEPTVEMTFSVNDSPFAGKEGKFVTSRQIRERLNRELLKDVSLRVRGGASRVCEPMERLVVDVPNDSVGAVMSKMGIRKGEMVSMNPVGSRTKIEFIIPERGLFGYKSEFLTDTKGEGVMNTVFENYQPFMGDIPTRTTGSLVAFETGTACAYGLFNVQDRGQLFVDAGTEVYEGMVVGVSPKAGDINVNVCKKKHLTNTRASGSDEALRLIPYKKMSLEESLEFISDDELVEVTPQSIRIRKRILDNELRAKDQAKRKK